jgi:hypothetical protein
MSVVGNLAKGAGRMLADDEAILFRQLLGRDVPLDEIARRIAVLRRAARRSVGDDVAPIDEFTGAMNRLQELLRAAEVMDRVTIKRLRKQGHVAHWPSIRKRLSAQVELANQFDNNLNKSLRSKPMSKTVSDYRKSARNAREYANNTKQEVQRMVAPPRGDVPNFREALSELVRLSPREALSQRRNIAGHTEQASMNMTLAEMLQVVQNILGLQ